MIADSPRCPGGCCAGSSHSSLPGWPASVVLTAHVRPPSVDSKMPGASTPTSTRPCDADTLEIFEKRRPSSYASPFEECSHVSPRSLERQIADPCQSLAAAAKIVP